MRETTEYKVILGFIDNSYWDDGSRSTTRTFHFQKPEQVKAFVLKALTEGLDIPGRSGIVKLKPRKQDFVVIRLHSKALNVEEFTSPTPVLSCT